MQASSSNSTKAVLIAMAACVSSQIAAYGYDAASRTLRVQFKRGSGGTYDYQNVEPETFAALEAAESKGSFVTHTIVRNPTKYPYTKLPPQEAPPAEEAPPAAGAAQPAASAADQLEPGETYAT